jgi:hypothetical protein
VAQTVTAKRTAKPRIRRREIARRAERILTTEPHYIYHESFDEPGIEEEIFGPPPERMSQRERTRAAKDADFYVAFLYQTDPLSRDEEFYLFRKMNYLKFRAYRLRQGLDPATVRLRDVEKIERIEREANELRNFIVECNLRLVTARAKHFARTTGLPLDELLARATSAWYRRWSISISPAAPSSARMPRGRSQTNCWHTFIVPADNRITS